MQTRELFDLSLTLAERHDVIVYGSRRLGDEALQRYWVASRCLLNLWGSALRRCTDELEELDYHGELAWSGWAPLLEEVMVSEVLCRVWLGVLEAVDARCGIREYGPVGRSLLRGHLDVRRRVLHLLLRGRQCGALSVWGLNRLRLNLERWTDLMLSLHDQDGITAGLCYDPRRLATFAAGSCGGGGRAAIASSVLRSVANTLLGESACIPDERAVHHAELAKSILSAWGEQLFRDTGPLLAGWQLRMMTLTDDAQGMLANWLGSVEPTKTSDSENPGRPGALGRF